MAKGTRKATIHQLSNAKSAKSAASAAAAAQDRRVRERRRPAEAVIPARVPYAASQAVTAPEIDHADQLDRIAHAALSRLTGGISPASLWLAWSDWASHLLTNPAKQHELLFIKPARKAMRFADFLGRAPLPDAEPCIEPLEHDRRFVDHRWQQWPFNVWQQSFLLTQQWLHNATSSVRGVSQHHEDLVTFLGRQLLDMLAPTNFAWSNPLVMQKAIETSGMNFVNGAANWLDDVGRQATGRSTRAPANEFEVGRNLAVTPGRVVFRNTLIELIQYSPSTPKVHAEPVLIVPAWIMKYYILDLSPHNSLVKYLVDQGHTVFMVSWKNPGAADRDLAMSDYLQYGLMDALGTVGEIVPQRKIHAVGYCLGGTLLAIGAAMMAREGDARLASMILFAAQTDFTEPGELGLYVDESQVTFLEDAMWDRGYLDSTQMAGAFQFLRPGDLIWSRMVQDYLLGERTPLTDLMAWNADATRMPYRMHSQYLRRLFLDNELAAGRFMAGGRPVSLNDLHLPIFMVGTETDHVAPWRSVYKLTLLANGEITFVLTSGGHNAGIVSEPGHPRRHYRLLERPADGYYVDPDSFLAEASLHEGSWWPAWQAWLQRRSKAMVAPPPMGPAGDEWKTLGDAPGQYVLQK